MGRDLNERFIEFTGVLWEFLFVAKLFNPFQPSAAFHIETRTIYKIQKYKLYKIYTQGEKCPYSELFCSVFSRIRTEYEEIRSISAYSVRMQENTDQNNSEYEHFLRSDIFVYIFVKSANQMTGY